MCSLSPSTGIVCSRLGCKSPLNWWRAEPIVYSCKNEAPDVINNVLLFMRPTENRDARLPGVALTSQAYGVCASAASLTGT